MEYHNSAIKKYVRGFSDFYSLWAFVALNQDRLVFPEVTAERYAEFMSNVISLARTKDANPLPNDENNVYVYLKNSLQSSTDYSHRAARNIALHAVLLKGSSPEGALTANVSHSDPSYPIA